MKHPLKGKGPVLGLLLSACALTVNAQKIEEQELKLNVNKITNSIEQLENLEPVTFKYETDKHKYLKLPVGEQHGFLASNVKAEFPAMVYVTSKMYNSGKNNSKVAKYDEVDTLSLIPVLVAAIKEQQAEIENLKNELLQLKQKSK